MKAVSQTCVKSAIPESLGLKQDSKILKAKMEHDNTAEMQECFHKLKDLVPSIPQKGKLSKTQLLQHVIDYILDLEIALDHTAVANMTNCRSPLSEKSEPNNILAQVTI